jgi:hypothetical protein
MFDGRLYEIPFEAVSISAAQDVIAIYGASSKIFALVYLELGAGNVVTPQNLRFRIRRLPATVTPGSGGTTPTPKPFSGSGDAAATITAHANDTVQATTGGTPEDKWATAWSLLNGTFFEPPRKKCPIFGINEACIISLDQAPTAAFVANGVAIVAEAP